ncbi:MAG: hypothetical protein V1704_01635 [Candidatus Vogelbacteria bacterium]
MLVAQLTSQDQRLRSHLGAIEVAHFQLVVDHGADLENLKVVGGYGFIEDIVECQIAGNRFLRSTKRGIEILNIVRIQFGRKMFSQEARMLILSSRLHLPGIIELLYWGIQHPEHQRQSSIVALGATTLVSGLRHLVYLDGDPISGRDLRARPDDDLLPPTVRFLAIDPL